MSVMRQLRAFAAALAILLIAGSAYAAPPAAAAAAPELPPAPLMLVVNTERVLTEAKAMKVLKGQAQEQQKALQREFQKRGDDLRATQAALRKEQSTSASPPDANLQERMRNWEKTAYDTQRESTQKNQMLEQGFNDGQDKVRLALTEIVQEIAKERGANMVLQAFSLIIFDDSYDITREALRRLDQKMPSVQLVLPKAPPPSAGGVEGGAPSSAPAPIGSSGKKK